MKRIAILTAAALAFGVGVASAQQHIPLPKPPNDIKMIRYPAPSAQYDKLVQYYLTLVRSLPMRFHVSQADTDIVVLMLKDCAGRVEADGIVTKDEAKYCENITMAKIHELATPYMMQQAAGGD